LLRQHSLHSQDVALLQLLWLLLMVEAATLVHWRISWCRLELLSQLLLLLLAILQAPAAMVVVAAAAAAGVLPLGLLC
jgi:hypothetical protein